MKRILISICCILTFFSAFNACTVTLPTAVRLKDSLTKPEEKSKDLSCIEKIKRNSKISITLINGREVEGKYKGLYKYKQADYVQIYSEFMQHHVNIFLPAFSDSINLFLISGEIIMGYFAGFDNKMLLINTSKRDTEQHIDILDIIKMTDKKKRSYDLEFIKSSLFLSKIPQIIGIGIDAEINNIDLIKYGTEPHIVPLYRVDKIEIKREKSPTPILGWIIAGAIIDLYISQIIASKALGGGLR